MQTLAPVPQIALHFGPEFPGYEGTFKVLKALFKNGEIVRSWSIGLAPYCDIQVSSLTMSRKHCTIFFDRTKGAWFLLDGGEHPDTPESVASYSPSTNGVWVSRSGFSRKDFYKINPGEADIIEPGSRIMLGPDLRFRIAVAYDGYPSYPHEPWLVEDWPRIVPRDSKPQPQIQPEIKKELHQQAADLANAPWQAELSAHALDRAATMPLGRLVLLLIPATGLAAFAIWLALR
jgi:pSer/pThr/pTyr-binding forkhead associated (FHA) protein